jgi:uncharacterized membrane protein YozB (DUF420 family)
MLNGPNVILALRIAVAGVTVLLLASLAALARGNVRLHGRINTVFFVLTLAALVGLELVARLIAPGIFREYFDAYPERERALYIHLCFAVPAAVLLPFMLITGRSHRRQAHLSLAAVFGTLWLGTVITGIFFL